MFNGFDRRFETVLPYGGRSGGSDADEFAAAEGVGADDADKICDGGGTGERDAIGKGLAENLMGSPRSLFRDNVAIRFNYVHIRAAFAQRGRDDVAGDSGARNQNSFGPELFALKCRDKSFGNEFVGRKRNGKMSALCGRASGRAHSCYAGSRLRCEVRGESFNSVGAAENEPIVKLAGARRGEERPRV
jgi:hypothetical protein